MILGSVNSIQVGRPRSYEADDTKPWTSAIGKHIVSDPVKVGRTNIEGDEQADLKNHGGFDKAVLAYAAEHYDAWNAQFPEKSFSAGAFGENLTISGFSETSCCVGDIMQIGDCLLQISQPRQPCWKLSRRWNLPKLEVVVQQTGRTGWYYRVLEEGLIEAGLPVELIERPFPDLNVAWASSVMYAKPRSKEDDLSLAKSPALSISWKETLLKRSTTN